MGPWTGKDARAISNLLREVDPHRAANEPTLSALEHRKDCWVLEPRRAGASLQDRDVEFIGSDPSATSKPDHPRAFEVEQVVGRDPGLLCRFGVAVMHDARYGGSGIQGFEIVHWPLWSA